MPPQAIAQRFEINYTSAAHAGPITGRLILFLARSAQPEPRLALAPRGPAIFGIDLDQLRPDQSAIVDASAIGYPVSISELPPGDYVAQAVINIYEQVHRADGKTIWVHLNDGSVEFFNTAAGNVYHLPEPFFVPAYVGTSGWLGLSFHVVGAVDRVDWDEVAELVDASYRLTAPAGLVKELDARA